ncbi:MAG TPA: MSMEG_6728 family protein [Propionibacteriaceae bacterium]|nr:MSMEG_6728 family protein [Propionibacteriaceae bacterium]
MQTFVPFSDFAASAEALDTKRLGKQRVEVIQIVRALTVPGYAWASHPAVLMWKGYEEALGRYGLTMCEVWQRRGFGDTCAATIATDLRTFGLREIRRYPDLLEADALPGWLFDPEVQRSHRSALVRKDPAHYSPIFPDVAPDLEYVWPVRSAAVVEREIRKAENRRRREQRAAERLALELAAAKRRRSQAAKRGWQTRAARQSASQLPNADSTGN